ncbi:MAG: hypothetical protein ACREQV_21660 [Candidatus Binatia bacterium]
MDKLSYKEYTITPGAIHDERTGKYAPTVDIAWRGADRKEDSYSFTLKERCPTFNDAIAVALEHAREWAHRWLPHVGP